MTLTRIRAARYEISNASNYVELSTDVQIVSANDVVITGDLVPAADDSHDLGTTSAAWQDLHLEGDVLMTDAGKVETAAGDITLSSAAGQVVIDAKTDIVLDAEGDDIIFKDNSVERGRFTMAPAVLTLSSSAGADLVLDSNGGKTFFKEGGTERGLIGFDDSGGFFLSSSLNQGLTLDSNQGMIVLGQGFADGGNNGVSFVLGDKSVQIEQTNYDPGEGATAFKFTHNDTFANQSLLVSGVLRFHGDNQPATTAFVGLKSPASGSVAHTGVTFTLPGSDGSSGQVLKTNGSGVLSFTDISGDLAKSVFQVRTGVSISAGVNGLILTGAATVDSSAVYCWAHPLSGGKQVVCESWRNLISVGATPIAITNCLNFGSPENEDNMGEFVECVQGIGEASKYLNFPVVSGNVSFYNQTKEVGIKPTPSIGGVGLIKDHSKMVTMDFKEINNLILIIGKTEGHMDQSLFSRSILDEKNGPPPEINLFNEKNNGETLLQLIRNDLVVSAHDISLGGMLTAISKMCIKGNKGFEFNNTKFLMSEIEYFFSEDQGRYVVEINPKDLKKVINILDKNSVHYDEIGKIIEKDLILNQKTKVTIDELKSYNTNWLKKYMS